jgi:IS1 family transposase
MNKLPLKKRAQLIGMLVEGNSLRATSRMADVSYNTVLKFISEMGAACSEFQDNIFHNLNCKRMQVDEIWSFCYAKDKTIKRMEHVPEDAGSVWTWTAICPDTKIVPSWFVGDRDAEAASLFINDLASRLNSRIQLTSDGFKAYIEAVGDAFGEDVDYAMLVKQYGASGKYVGCVKEAIVGKPDIDNVSTSFVERQNLTMRMGMRRFIRKTNGFSKKVENHAHAVSLHFMYYNFGRIHKTLRVTPAMEAGITDHIWSLEEIAGLVKDEASKERGAYKTKMVNDLLCKS